MRILEVQNNRNPGLPEGHPKQTAFEIQSIQQLVYALAEDFERSGHETEVLDRGIPKNVESLARRADVIHVHKPSYAFRMARYGTPVVYTHHFDMRRFRWSKRFVGDNIHVVSVSRYMRDRLPHPSRCVRNGIPLGGFRPARRKDRYAAMGRLDLDKGFDIAAHAARRAGVRLDICGQRVRGRNGEAYFEHAIKPWLGGGVRHVGVVHGARKTEVLAKTKALIHASRWEEPFGLVLVEALASGAPVIGMRGHGPLREVCGRCCVEVSGVPELIDVLRRGHSIRPADCVERARMWGTERMARGYLALFERLLRGRDPTKPKVFGVGLSRTGTLSLTAALQVLGYSAKHFPVTEEAIRRNRCVTDTPASVQWRELAEWWPEAKFVLTVRADAAAWLDSVERMIRRWPPERVASGFGAVVNEALYGSATFDRGTYLAARDRHESEVREHFRAEGRGRLLVMDLSRGDGWRKLCGFLGEPEPGGPFPRMKNV